MLIPYVPVIPCVLIALERIGDYEFFDGTLIPVAHTSKSRSESLYAVDADYTLHTRLYRRNRSWGFGTYELK